MRTLNEARERLEEAALRYVMGGHKHELEEACKALFEVLREEAKETSNLCPSAVEETMCNPYPQASAALAQHMEALA